MLKNVAGQNITALLLDTDGAAVTTGTTTVYVTGDAGTQASMGTATHEGNGAWSIDVTQAESNYDDIGFTWVNSGAVTVHQHVFTDQAYDRLGAPAGASIAADIAVIEGQTDDIGVAGAGLTALASASALATAQADLDTITGIDGVTLATAQALYAPSKAGDAMALSAGAITNAALAGNMEIVFETDFATNYNATRNAWVTNYTDTIGTDPVTSFAPPTKTEMDSAFTEIKGATWDSGTDTLEAIRDRGDAAWTTGAGGTPPDLLQSTTIATLASQTSFTLTAGSADDDTYNDQIAIITDSATSTQKAVATISDYTGSTKTVTLSADPAIFTMAVGDAIDIVAATGAAGSGATAAEVWGYTTRILTANTNLNDPTAATIADAVWDEAQADHVAAGSMGLIASETADILTDTGTTLPATLSTIEGKVDTVDTNVDAVLVDTGTTLPATLSTIEGKVDTVDTNVDAVLVDTGTTLPGTLTTIDGKVDTVDTVADGIKAKTDSLTFTVASQVDANAIAISGSTAAADNLKASAETIVVDSVASGYSETTTTLKGGGTASLSSTDDHYNGRIIIFTSGTLANQATDITDYDGTTNVFTVTALTSAPADSTTFVIV